MKYNLADSIRMIKFLRFRKKDPAKSKKTYMSLKAIAKLLNKSITYVHYKC